MKPTNANRLVLAVTFVLCLLGQHGVANAQSGGALTDTPIQIGRSDAPIKLEIFYDMQCPSCAAFHPKLKAALAKYKDRMFITFRHFPISFHDKAFAASVAVEAAKQQGKGFEMLDRLVSKQSEWATTPKYRDLIIGYAAKLDLDITKFTNDFSSNKFDPGILMDIDRGKRRAVMSVPTVFLNGKEISYPEAMDIENTIKKGN